MDAFYLYDLELQKIRISGPHFIYDLDFQPLGGIGHGLAGCTCRVPWRGSGTPAYSIRLSTPRMLMHLPDPPGSTNKENNSQHIQNIRHFSTVPLRLHHSPKGEVLLLPPPILGMGRHGSVTLQSCAAGTRQSWEMSTWGAESGISALCRTPRNPLTLAPVRFLQLTGKLGPY